MRATKKTKDKDKIETCGELREFLAGMMVQVKNGTMDLDSASRVTKLAAQINENFYAEAKVSRLRADTGEQMAELGHMIIGKNGEING